MANHHQQQATNYQLTPLARQSAPHQPSSQVATRFPSAGCNSAVTPGLRRQSEVYCNVRHMLSYIDQVESENFRHSKAIDDQFQAIKQELYAALRGEQTMRSSSSLVALLSADHRQWAPLIEQMERDLQRNQMASTGIGRNLAQLKAAIEEMKMRGKGAAAIAPKGINNNTATTASYLLDTPDRGDGGQQLQSQSLQYRTPLTDPIAPFSSLNDSPQSIQMPRRGTGPSSSVNIDADAGLFKVPFPPGRTTTTALRNSNSSSIITESSTAPLLSVKAGDSERLRNVILGLPKVDPLEMTMSAEQYRLHVEESLHWVDRWHVNQQRK